jgi:predicted transcriptional regulator
MVCANPDIEICPTPVRLTGKQHLALAMARAGYTHAFIATELHVTRQAVSQVIRRGRQAQRQIIRATQDILDRGSIAM